MDDSIFVFGSNQSGIHGAGAARTAFKEHGAKWGKAEGRQGNSYAIPTKDRNIRYSLPLSEIQEYVDRFISYAEDHPELRFQVTRIGCGLAGLRDEDIAPMFHNAPDNCWFDSAWLPIFHNQMERRQRKFWGNF